MSCHTIWCHITCSEHLDISTSRHLDTSDLGMGPDLGSPDPGIPHIAHVVYICTLHIYVLFHTCCYYIMHYLTCYCMLRNVVFLHTLHLYIPCMIWYPQMDTRCCMGCTWDAHVMHMLCTCCGVCLHTWCYYILHYLTCYCMLRNVVFLYMLYMLYICSYSGYLGSWDGPDLGMVQISGWSRSREGVRIRGGSDLGWVRIWGGRIRGTSDLHMCWDVVFHPFSHVAFSGVVEIFLVAYPLLSTPQICSHG